MTRATRLWLRGSIPPLPLSPAVKVTDVKPTTLFTGDPNYDKFGQDQFRIGYQFEHRFNDALKVRQNLRYGEVNSTIAI